MTANAMPFFRIHKCFLKTSCYSPFSPNQVAYWLCSRWAFFLQAQVKPAWMSKFHSKRLGERNPLHCLLGCLLACHPLEGSFFYGRFLSYLLGSFAYKQHHQWWWLFSTTPCIFSEMEGPNFYELEPPAAAAVPAPGCCRKRRNGNFRPHTHTDIHQQQQLELPALLTQ